MTSSVTVLVCAYDAADTLPAALDSALAQTLARERFEVLVVDDGSTDRTSSVLDEYRGRGVEVVRLPRNTGLPAAANAGLEQIATRFFVRLDADDEFEAELLEALLETAAREHANLVYPDRRELAADGTERIVRLAAEPEVGLMVAAGKLLPTRLVSDLGGYRDLFWEEIDLYLRLLESGEIRTAHVPRPLYRYTVGRAGQMTTDAEAVRHGWDELRKVWPADVLGRHGLDTDYAVGRDRP